MVTEKELIELGFGDKEAKVYLALLELGPSSTTEISRLAKINRPLLRVTQAYVYFIIILNLNNHSETRNKFHQMAPP
jgi:hypothetical protein